MHGGDLLGDPTLAPSTNLKSFSVTRTEMHSPAAIQCLVHFKGKIETENQDGCSLGNFSLIWTMGKQDQTKVEVV